MNKIGLLRVSSIALTTLIAISSLSVDAYAQSSVQLPSAGIDLVLGDGTSVKDIKDSREQKNSPKAEEKSTSSTSQDSSSTASLSSQTATATATSAPVNQTTSLAASSEEVVTTSEDGTIEVKKEAIEAPVEEKTIEETAVAKSEKSVPEKEREIDAKNEIEHFKNLVIAQVDHYVNVRKGPSEDEEIVGKLYDDSAGELLEETENGWYKISSGSCTGYVKAEFCVTGEDAVELARKVGKRVATVNTTTLYVRAEPSSEDGTEILGMVPDGEVLSVLEELDGWVKVDIEEGHGYVSLDYVKLSTEFVSAESKEEEEARLAKEERERQAAIEAANKARKNSSSSSSKKNSSGQTVYASGGSELGRAVANYGLQFVGNPYVYGGSSLTNGTDCSGFVMSVYKNFGVNLPHSSSADRSVGYAVDGLSNAQPGDLICYSGHVALYIGNGQIVHASTKKTGIKVSNADYRTILAIRRIF
ncbi:MAG: C40 family peptidase [Lachnospiraceae bacterium]|nr:C40 family peptidase [Lachnospiraceae bacterium]